MVKKKKKKKNKKKEQSENEWQRQCRPPPSYLSNLEPVMLLSAMLLHRLLHFPLKKKDHGLQIESRVDFTRQRSTHPVDRHQLQPSRQWTCRLFEPLPFALCASAPFLR